MSAIHGLFLGLTVCVSAAPPERAGNSPTAKPDEETQATTQNSASVEKVFTAIRDSVVVVTAPGRESGREGLGAGFVIDGSGLIATNLHVIGEGRPITVRTLAGKRHAVTAIHAWDRALDLAILRVDAKDLPPLTLAGKDEAKVGQSVVAVGNPLGLTHSVVSGVISAIRVMDGRPMLQLAIPVEPGNSGGPVVDMSGRVHGVVTMKSRVTENLGFAVAIEPLKLLLKKPNSMPMDRWLRRGAIDAARWESIFGAQWRKRGSVFEVEGAGAGFGGRALLLSKDAAPTKVGEIQVDVRLEDEAGAAGLAFAADGNDRHYGFYPTAGRLRLTRFDGADVQSWNILRDVEFPAYRRGDWNTLRVRIEPKRIVCYCNDQEAFAVDVESIPTGRIGLAKFRDTKARFRGFRSGDRIAPAVAASGPDVTHLLEGFDPEKPSASRLADLATQAPVSVAAIRKRADELEKKVAQWRRLADTVHVERVVRDLAKGLDRSEESIDLAETALTMARLDQPDLDVAPYQALLDEMADDVKKSLGKDGDDDAAIARLNRYLFEEQGFHGSRMDSQHRGASYLNDVLDEREGLPISLSVVYMELARRLGLKVEGVGLPGHFVVRFRPTKGEPRIIDVFDGAKEVSLKEANRRVMEATGRPPTDEELAPAKKRSIIVRMLRNLLNAAQREQDSVAAQRYLDAILALEPGDTEARWVRILLRARDGRRAEAISDVDWLLEREPEGVDLDRLLELRRMLAR